MLPNCEHAGGNIGLRKMITHVSRITIASAKKDARELFTDRKTRYQEDEAGLRVR